MNLNPAPENPAPPSLQPQRVLPVWLADALATQRGPLAASTWAWDHRWSPVPVDLPTLEAIALHHELTTADLRHLVLIAARRAHFAFAFETLSRLCQDALERFPDDELLTVLCCAADVALGRSSWQHLEALVATCPADGISEHVLLTSVYLSEDAPREVLERALSRAEALTANGDLIAHYRTVSILRRLGCYAESLRAGMRVNEELVSGRYAAGICDHLSERVLTERHLAVELLGLGERQAARDAAERLGNMGL